jgi:hypothetical protein
MEPEGSVPHSQVATTFLYPEPAQSSPYPTSHFIKIHINIILPSHAWVSPVVSFPQVSLPKPCTRLSPIRATCLANLIDLDFITLQ